MKKVGVRFYFDKEIFMSNQHESMIGIMKLYDLRREATMREAREWFNGFYAASFEDITNVFEGGEDRFFRQVLTYWDMAAAFVNHGAIDEQLFNEVNIEHVIAYAKVEPFIEDLRELAKEPALLANLEKLIRRIPNVEEKMASFRERTKERQLAKQKAAVAA
jgi:hypothetical protein